MSIKQRREREKQEVRQGILTAAREIARQEGWQSVTIRKVAERIEYSPPTIYEYFESKEDILTELLREGFRQLAATLKAIREAMVDPEQRLLDMAEAYWNFAMSNPELYQVMNGLGGVPFAGFEKPAAAHEVFDMTKEALVDWARTKGVDIPDIRGAVEIIRSLVHGLISLTMVDRLSGGDPHAKELLRRAMRDLLVGWSARQKE